MPRPAATIPAPPAPLDELWTINVGRVLGWLRRGALLIVACALILAMSGAAFSLVTKPRYTAHAEILVDPTNLQVVPDDIYAQNQQRDSQLLEAESMLGVLTSGNTLKRVVTDLDLTQDSEFVKPVGDAPGTARPPEDLAVEALASRIKAVRDDGSFVVSINIWSDSADKSVRLVNSLIAAFQEELAQGEAEGARRSVASVTEQLAELKQKVSEAEDAVQVFRRTHGLQETNGQLTSGQTMSQFNAQVTDAQSRLIAAQARYDALVNSGNGGASADALQSATMTALRTQLATVKQEYDSSAATLGPNHPTMQSLARQVKVIEKQIQLEINRTVAAAKADVDAAKASLKALNTQASDARNAVAVDDQAQVQLRELQREADSRTAIYQAYLSRADQLAQRQQIDTTNMRVISPPLTPTKSWPPSPLLAAPAGFVGGALLGILVAASLGFWRDYRRLRPRAVK